MEISEWEPMVENHTVEIEIDMANKAFVSV